MICMFLIMLLLHVVYGASLLFYRLFLWLLYIYNYMFKYTTELYYIKVNKKVNIKQLPSGEETSTTHRNQFNMHDHPHTCNNDRTYLELVLYFLSHCVAV